MTNTSVYKKRLLKLADFLDHVPRKKFNLSVIVDVVHGVVPSKKYLKNEKSCGTVCCAIGWMPVVFPRRLRYERTFSDNTDLTVTDRKTGDTNWTAVRDFLNIDYYVANRLFLGDYYPGGSRATGPKEVARKIRKFVRTGKVD